VNIANIDHMLLLHEVVKIKTRVSVALCT